MAEIIQIVEFDMDFCALSYGTGACNAVLGSTGQAKCFNTFKTCQDKANYDKGSLTLRFGKNVDGMPKGVTIFPALTSVSINPLKINLSALDGDLSPLGRSERVTIKMKDFLYSDVLTDKYRAERISGAAQQSGIGYNPHDQGTFFSRLASRNPFYFGRAIRVLQGDPGQALSAMDTRHYVVEEFSSPDVNGNVTIVARDLFSATRNESALCPQYSGAVSGESDNPFELEPAGIGATLPASGKCLIKGKITDFTRLGDVITLSDPPDGSLTGASFQPVYVVENEAVNDVLYDLIVNFLGADASLIDSSAWQSEYDNYGAGMTLDAQLTEPENALDLISEICQLGVVVWMDTRSQKIEYRHVRAPSEIEVSEINDDRNILERSIKTTDRHDLRVSQVAFYHDIIDPKASASSNDNFDKLLLTVDLDSESTNQYNKSNVKTFYTRWIGADDTALTAIAARLLDRNNEIPTDMTFDIDIKDRALVPVMGFIDVTSRVFSDFDGASQTIRMQVKEVNEIMPGIRARITAQSIGEG